MPELIDMKSEKKNQPEQPTAVGYSKGSQYPWGLSVTLENEALEKLGINYAAFPTGTKVKLTCEAEVTGRSESEGHGSDKPCRSISLQITKMMKPSISKENRMKEGTALLEAMRGGK